MKIKTDNFKHILENHWKIVSLWNSFNEFDWRQLQRYKYLPKLYSYTAFIESSPGNEMRLSLILHNALFGLCFSLSVVTLSSFRTFSLLCFLYIYLNLGLEIVWYTSYQPSFKAILLHSLVVCITFKFEAGYQVVIRQGERRR